MAKDIFSSMSGILADLLIPFVFIFNLYTWNEWMMAIEFILISLLQISMSLKQVEHIKLLRTKF